MNISTSLINRPPLDTHQGRMGLNAWEDKSTALQIILTTSQYPANNVIRDTQMVNDVPLFEWRVIAKTRLTRGYTNRRTSRQSPVTPAGEFRARLIHANE